MELPPECTDAETLQDQCGCMVGVLLSQQRFGCKRSASVNLNNEQQLGKTITVGHDSAA